MSLDWVVTAVGGVAKLFGWVVNLQSERLKKKIWGILHHAEPQGLTAEGIHNEFIGDIIGDVPFAALWGEAPRQTWIEIRHRWRVFSRLPTVGQISNALYEMTKEGTVKHVRAGRYTV